MWRSTRCINSTSFELLQWPFPDCSGVPAVIDTVVAPPQCAASQSQSTGLEVDTCVTGTQLTFPVRRAGFVNIYSRFGEDCAFPPAPGIKYYLNALVPLDKCVRDDVFDGSAARTYTCSAAGLTVRRFAQETCSPDTPPNVTIYQTDVCLQFAQSFIITCPSEAAPQQAATSQAVLIGGLAAGGLAIAAVGGYFLWAHRATLFPGASEKRGVYATLEMRVGRC